MRTIVKIPELLRGDAGETRRIIQAAIDDCAAQGGGDVYIPAGEYTTCSIELRSRVALCLDQGCVLISPANEEDFLPIRLRGRPSSNSPDTSHAVVFARECERIALRGGVIVGRGREFWTPKESLAPSWRSTPARYLPKPFRPMTLLFQGCRDIDIEGLVIRDSPVYSAWLLSCSRVRFASCRVENDFYGPNTDGYHLSSCTDVRVEDCFFRTGDDSIAVDGNDSGASREIVIRGCTFDTSVNALRVYTGLDPFLDPSSSRHSCVRGVSMERCRVQNAAGVLNITAQGGEIEDIRCFDIDANMRAEGTPLFIMTDGGRVSGVAFGDIRAECNGIATLIGTKAHPVEKVTMENLTMTVRPVRKLYELEVPDPIPNYAHHHFAPCNLYARHVRDITARGIAVRWERNPDFPHAFCAAALRDAQRVLIEGFDTAAYDETGRLPVVSAERCEDLIVRD